MGWGKVAEYLLASAKWMWQNKWTMLFMITTIIFLIMNFCKEKDIEKLTEELQKEKGNFIVLTAKYDVIEQTNNDNLQTLNKCKNNLNAIEKSYKESKVLIDSFDEELNKFKFLSRDIDKVDRDEQFILKKTILQKLFKGKNAIQIRKEIRK